MSNEQTCTHTYFTSSLAQNRLIERNDLSYEQRFSTPW